MNTNDTNRQKAHAMIDHIFKDLLPAQGMAERSEQIKLSHRMLDTMLNGGIALCDAGTGIGKTYAYLVAAAAANRSDTEALRKPVIISTSSIALQNAVQTEYLPLLSCILLADGQIDRPLFSVIRKGKGHYVGTYIALTTLERYWWGEGEMKFYIDGDDEYPTICGTGTEDYFGGAWSFATQQNGQTVENQYCTPYLGYPYYSTHDTFLHNDYHNDDQMPQRSFYRWHLLDPILFEKDLKVTLQQIGVSHGGLFERQDDVATTAYWYQTHPHVPFAPLMSRKERWPR